MNNFTRLFIVFLLLIPLGTNAQYCMLPNRTSYSALQPGITNFKLKNINRTSGNVEKPLIEPSVVVTTDSVVLERGKTYTVTITHTRDDQWFPTARNNIRIWIDYNKNFSWEDAGETVLSADYQTYGVFTGTFTVPATAPLGTTWMRATAKMSSDAGHTPPTPCDDPEDPLDYHGEMEDYKVIIAAPNAVEDILRGSNFAIFPNPAGNVIHIAFPEATHQPMQVELLDMTGKLVSKLLTTGNQAQTTYQFDISELSAAPGLYLVKVTSGAHSSYQKFLKSQ